MNVFVLCAGRVASTAFSEACQYATNYTAAHESNVGKMSCARVEYPENHIEIDNRLVWFLPLLEEKYGDNAIYVYLKRDKDLIARSYEERWYLTISIVKAYGYGILMFPRIKKKERYAVCRDYVELSDKLIESFLARQKKVVDVDLGKIKNGEFQKFWNFAGVKGDFELAMKEWDKSHNKNKKGLGYWLDKVLSWVPGM